ncbi:MAG: moderate conductance mechanosensitive channel [Actinomycetota bacterium]|jgi:small conductance mechanosensitive channel
MSNGSHGYIYELLRKLGLSRFQASTGEFLLVRPLKIVLILVLALLLARFASRALRRVIGTAQKRSPLRAASPRAETRAGTVGDVVGNLVRSLILLIAFLMALGQLGLNLAPLIAGAGIAGVAIGFGAQTLVRDFLSGLFILLEDQFGVGDTIDLGAEVVGVVEEVNLRTTRLRAADGTVFFVPNGEIKRVGNASMDFSRAVVDVPIGRNVDVMATLAAISEVATALGQEWSDRIMQAPQMLGVQNIAVEGTTVRVTALTAAGEQFAVARELRARILDRLRRGVAQ